MSKPKDMDFEDYDKEVQEMEERFGGKWQELCLDIINAPAAYTLDTLWEKMILARNPNYGDWEYPGQAGRHLVAEWEAVQAELSELREGVQLLRAEYERHKHLDDFLSDSDLRPLGQTGSAILHELWAMVKKVIGVDEPEA